ncbi:hypothetical protein E2562_016529 [Oryza meyeriana var. granulata]|uniref:DUF1618 domain-containing protein n=1 Tax=Oryza meyeriana var. granulata TaxID=110450 RepID=A0A6G1C6L0_9ORYZ|nr:hypothetical protein E2562_016529 [Oryza meyeriana var. granulata]
MASFPAGPAGGSSRASMEAKRDLSPFIPNWVVIEPEICCKDILSYRRDGGGASATSAEAQASNGELVRVSFDLIAPSAGISRLFLYCPKDRQMSSFDTVVAAHGDSVLFRLEINYEGLCPLACYAVDCFVYRAGGAHPSGGLELSLVPCFYPTDDEFTAAPEDSWVRTSPWRMRNAQAIVLLRTGERGFVVAELRPYAAIVDDENDRPLSADLFRLRSDGAAFVEWEVKLITTAGAGKGTRGDVCWWQMNKVVAFDTFLGWVDLYRGVILCDVNDENRCPQASQMVCVTASNEMKFNVTITIWTLRQTCDG